MTKQFIADELRVDDGDMGKYLSGKKPFPKKHLDKFLSVTKSPAQTAGQAPGSLLHF